MARRGGLLVCLIVLASSTVGPAARASAPAGASGPAELEVARASGPASGEVVLKGTGTAHGLGMAMDGVEGQARAGWTHDQILSLFYPGTASGNAAGTIRVGLAAAPVAELTLPNGGTVSDAPRGAAAGAGLPVVLPSGSKLTLRVATGGVAMTLPARPAPERTSPRATHEPDAPLVRGSITLLPRRAPSNALAGARSAPSTELVPTPPPPPVVEPSPTPSPKRPEQTAPPEQQQHGGRVGESGVQKRVFVWGTGDPAVVGVGATGHAYRGAIEVSPRSGALSVVNHVDLETYVAGIAEEKGADWPIEALKALAIAARTLGAATMSWYDKSQAQGFDICPTDHCQVYHGYDGEEPSMRRAQAETAGVIRTYKGRPILAMYHGNGGGQTETYKRLIDYSGDPHPYLKSVKYPYADPYHWKRVETWTSIDASLRSSGVAVPGGLQGMDVVERGDSPRIIKLRLRGADGDVTISGQRFMDALDLWSTWFDISTAVGASSVVVQNGSGYPIAIGSTSPADQPERSWVALVVAMLAFLALGWATNLVVSRELAVVGGGLRGFWARVRVSGALLYGGDAAG